MRTISISGGAGVLLELLKAARQEPVTVIDGGRPAAVVLSIEEYERMRGVAWDRLMGTMERIRIGARERGLTDEALDSLLADESRLHVVDTNVLISAVLQPSGTTARVLTKIRAAGGLLVFSDATFTELATRIMRPKFDRYVNAADRQQFLSELAAVGRFVAIEGNLRACRDPEDDRILETAIRSEAGCIVTGDRDLLVLHPFRGIDIFSPGHFLLAVPNDAPRT